MKKLDLRAKWVVPGVLGITLMVLLAACAILWLRHDEEVDNGAVAVATEGAVSFFSLDHRHARDDVDKMLSLATGKFNEEYAAEADQIVEAVEKQRLVVTAEVPENGVAVEYFHQDDAQFLVAVDVTTVTKTRAAEESRYRARIKLTRVDGSWRVSGVEQVG